MISISIVSFNALEDTVLCVDSILEHTKLAEFEILINAFNFNAENRQKISERYSRNQRVVITYTDGIRGYSANHNMNLAHARYDIVCILNDDTFIRQDIFSDFFRLMQDPDVGGCCPVFLNFDGSVQMLYRKVLSPWRYIGAKLRMDKLFPSLSSYEDVTRFDSYKNLETHEIDYGLGACYCINMKFLKDRKLSEEYFLGPDDLYWSYLLRKNYSKKILLSCRDFIYHRGHSVISNHFASALPAQIKGMVDLFGKMNFRYMIVFKIFFFGVLLLGYGLNSIAYVLTQRERFLHLRKGYGNTIRIFWRNASNPAIFRFFYTRENSK